MFGRKGLACVAAAVACLWVLAAPAAAQEKDVVWALSQAPADACVVLTVRGVQEFETALKAYVGPDGESIDLVKSLEGNFPAGALDTAGPLVAAVLPGAMSPSIVALLKIKDETKLTGEAVEGGLVKCGESYILKMAPWAAVSNSPDALKGFAAATARITGLDAQREAIGAHLAWASVNPKSLAAVAKATLDAAAQPGQPEPGPQVMAMEMITWLAGLLDQVQSVTATLDVKPEAAALAVDVKMDENTPLAAVAAATLPIESYKGGLPMADRLVVAGWMRMDWGKAAGPMKTIVKPLIDRIIAAKVDDAAKKSVDDMWAMFDEWVAVMGSDVAVAMEPAPPGQGMYRLSETFTVKDPAEYAKLKARMMGVSKGMMKAMMGQMGAMPGGPSVKMDMDYKEAAETIEGLPVDLMKMKVDVELPPDAPPQAREQIKAMMDATYGPEGMTVRMALAGKTAVISIGGADAMAGAIKAARGQAPDLTANPKVAEAVGRLPKGPCAGGVISFANLMYMTMSMTDRVLGVAMPPEIKEAAQKANLPPLEAPPAADLSTAAAVVKGTAIHLDLAVPQADIRGAVAVAKRGTERMIMQMKLMQERMQKEGGAPGAASPAPIPAIPEAAPKSAPGAAAPAQGAGRK